MSDLLIRNLDPEIRRSLEKRAQQNGRSLSAEAQRILSFGLTLAGAPANSTMKDGGQLIHAAFAPAKPTDEEFSVMEKAWARKDEKSRSVPFSDDPG